MHWYRLYSRQRGPGLHLADGPRMAQAKPSLSHPLVLQAQEADSAAILSRTASGWVPGGAWQLACTLGQLMQRHAWAMRDSRAQWPRCRGPVGSAAAVHASWGVQAGPAFLTEAGRVAAGAAAPAARHRTAEAARARPPPARLPLTCRRLPLPAGRVPEDQSISRSREPGSRPCEPQQ